MKLYKYLISGGLALTLSLSSCESWLEVEPNDTRTTDYFYSTPSEMEQAISVSTTVCFLFRTTPGLCRKFVQTMRGWIKRRINNVTISI